MKFVLKFAVAIIFCFICLLFLLFEWLAVYYILTQCDWPQLDPRSEDPAIDKPNEKPLHALVLTDTHLLGRRRGIWIERVRLEWEMHQVFQTAVKLHQPDVVFVLGDLLDEGEYGGIDEFNGYVKRFYSLFAVPENTQMYLLVGNHDVGFHYSIEPHLIERFAAGFDSPAAQLLTLRGNHFVLLNSIGLQDDGCFLCSATDYQLAEIAKQLKCTTGEISCDNKTKLEAYSRPILMQHYPLYRESDEHCHEPDEAPYPEKVEKFKEAWDCLSQNATHKLLGRINPRLVLCGHTHHGCTRNLTTGEGVEITLPSFNWKHKNNPSYGLLVVTPNNYAFSKCLMPKQSSAIIRYVLTGACLIFGLLYWCCRTKRKTTRYSIVA